jgi:hypothetical protein
MLLLLHGWVLKFISTGSNGSRPNSRKYGVIPVVSCLVLLYAWQWPRCQLWGQTNQRVMWTSWYDKITHHTLPSTRKWCLWKV